MDVEDVVIRDDGAEVVGRAAHDAVEIVAAHDEVDYGVAALDATKVVFVSQSLSLLYFSVHFFSQILRFHKNNLI